MDLLYHFAKYGKNEQRMYTNKIIKIKPQLELSIPEVLLQKYYLNKINFIDKIIWINLNKSTDRRNYMELILHNINIQNHRIEAIDGNNLDNVKLNNINMIKKLSNYEIACCLSHIKSINYLNSIDGDYFMICEDDIAINNLYYFNKKTLKDIIFEAPNFDILLLYKTYSEEVDNLYVRWKDYYNELDKTIYGTVCYIISRSGINKIYNYVKYFNNDNNNIFEFNNEYNKEFNLADIYLYNNLETIVYKYNFINTNNENDSLIHNEHLDFHKICNEKQLDIIIRDKDLL
jgi:GR25 family glycosyltransferase involved in LPS biosynthesis